MPTHKLVVMSFLSQYVSLLTLTNTFRAVVNQLGDTEKASAILYKTSCSKPNGHFRSTTSFHKVPIRNLQEHCLSEPSFLVNLTFPKYACRVCFICHLVARLLLSSYRDVIISLDNFTSSSKNSKIKVYKYLVTGCCLEQILPFALFVCSFNLPPSG